MSHRNGSKVRTIAIASAAMCTLAAAAWLVPQSAKADIASELGRPYVESSGGLGLVPVSASSASASIGTLKATTRGDDSELTLTDAQQRAFEALAKREIAARLGTALPSNLTATFTAYDDAGNVSLTVQMTNASPSGSANGSGNYVASFMNVDLAAGTGTVTSVMRRGDIAESEVASYAAKARQAFVDDLGVELPQGYPLDAMLSTEPGSTGVKLMMQWYNTDPSVHVRDPLSGEEIHSFVASYTGVNLATGAGDLMQLERYRGIDNSDAAPTLTDAQQATLEAAARAYARKKGIELGKLTVSTRVSGTYTPGLQLEFACPGREAMTITVAADGTIQGYGFYRAKG